MKVNKKPKHRLFEYLDAIRSEEFFRLKRYIHSDFFNTNKRLKKLFDALRVAKTSAVKYSEMDVESIYRKTFPNRKGRSMRDDFSGILSLVRGFIAQEEYKKDSAAKTRYLLRGLENRQVHHRFRLLINGESKNYEKGGTDKRVDVEENYLHDVLIADHKYRYYTIHENRKMSTNELLQEYVDSLDRYYAMTKIQFWSMMKQRTILFGYLFRYGNISDIKRIVADTKPEYFPLLHIHYHIAELWNNTTIENFDTCKDFLFEYSERFSRYNQQNLLQTLINFCKMNVMGEQPHMWNLRLLELYEQFFERGFCYIGRQQRNQQISPHHFRNYMQLLIELDEFDRFKTLKEQYAPQVAFKNEAEQRFVNKYNEAALHFARYLSQRRGRPNGEDNAYDIAPTLKCIQSMESEVAKGAQVFPDRFYRILYEILLLKIYFEQEEGFTKRRKAFSKYVNSQKHISPVFLRPYLNFATVVLKLYQIKHREIRDEVETQQLKDELSQMQIVERAWLEEKLDTI